MTQGNDEQSPGKDNLSAEIDKTMAEAEAVVQDIREDDDVIDIDDDAGEGGGGSQDAEVTALRERVASLQEQIAATKDKWLRALADLENFKKRSKKELDDQALRTAQNLLPAFLPVLDNLERALGVAEPTAAGASDDNAENVRNLVQGIEMVRKEFLAALGRNGIEPLDSVGKVFDPAMHDALQQFDSPDHPPGVVIQEFEKGYQMKGRLLRPARVIVAGAGSTGAATEDSAAEAVED